MTEQPDTKLTGRAVIQGMIDRARGYTAEEHAPVTPEKAFASLREVLTSLQVSHFREPRDGLLRLLEALEKSPAPCGSKRLGETFEKLAEELQAHEDTYTHHDPFGSYNSRPFAVKLAPALYQAIAGADEAGLFTDGPLRYNPARGAAR